MTPPGDFMDSRLRKAADYLLRRRHMREIHPAQLGADILPILFIVDIERGEDGPSLKLRFMGTALDATFKRSLTGRRLEEFIHGPRGNEVMQGFRAAAEDHGACWMRQIMQIKDDVPRFVEGLAIYLEPERLYGALAVGTLADRSLRTSFEIAQLERAFAFAAI